MANKQRTDAQVKIEELIKIYTEEQRAQIDLVLGSLKNSAAELLLSYSRNELTDKDFIRKWNELGDIYFKNLDETGKAYFNAVEKAVYRGRKTLTDSKR